MKKTGIWLDKKMAYVISTDASGTQQIRVVLSKIEDFHVRGGSGTVFKGGPQNVVQDSRYLEREKHQFKAYFQEIVGLLKDSEKILIFGPAEAGEKLKNELLRSYPALHAKVSELIKTDSMTKNQMKAFVKDYFAPASADT